MIFDIENWLWKSYFGTFWQLSVSPKLNTQNLIISFRYVDSEAKILLILYPPFENSTTHIAITSIYLIVFGNDHSFEVKVAVTY